MIALEELYTSLLRVGNGVEKRPLDGVVAMLVSQSGVSTEDSANGSFLQRALLASAKMMNHDVTDAAEQAVQTMKDNLKTMMTHFSRHSGLDTTINRIDDRFCVFKSPEILAQFLRFTSILKSDNKIDHMLRDMLSAANHGADAVDEITKKRRELHLHLLKDVHGLADALEIDISDVDHDRGSTVNSAFNDMTHALMVRDKIDDRMHKLLKGHTDQFAAHVSVGVDNLEQIFNTGTARRLTKALEMLSAQVNKDRNGNSYSAFYEIVQSVQAAASLYKLLARLARAVANDLTTVCQNIK
jgi:hypothetical protein